MDLFILEQGEAFNLSRGSPFAPPDSQVTLKTYGPAPAAASVTWWLNVPKFGWGVARSISDQKRPEHLPPKVMSSESIGFCNALNRCKHGYGSKCE